MKRCEPSTMMWIGYIIGEAQILLPWFAVGVKNSSKIARYYIKVITPDSQFKIYCAVSLTAQTSKPLLNYASVECWPVLLNCFINVYCDWTSLTTPLLSSFNLMFIANNISVTTTMLQRKISMEWLYFQYWKENQWHDSTFLSGKF